MPAACLFLKLVDIKIILQVTKHHSYVLYQLYSQIGKLSFILYHILPKFDCYQAVRMVVIRGI